MYNSQWVKRSQRPIFSQKKMFIKIQTKNTILAPPLCHRAEPKFVSSSEVVVHICRDVDVLKKSKKLDWQANKI